MNEDERVRARGTPQTGGGASTPNLKAKRLSLWPRFTLAPSVHSAPCTTSARVVDQHHHLHIITLCVQESWFDCFTFIESFILPGVECSDTVVCIALSIPRSKDSVALSGMSATGDAVTAVSVLITAIIIRSTPALSAPTSPAPPHAFTSPVSLVVFADNSHHARQKFHT